MVRNLSSHVHTDERILAQHAWVNKDDGGASDPNPTLVPHRQGSPNAQSHHLTAIGTKARSNELPAFAERATSMVRAQKAAF